MSKHDEYRRNAEHAQQMAELSGAAEDKASWLRLAAGWLSLLRQSRPTNGHGQQHFAGQPLASGQQGSRRTH